MPDVYKLQDDKELLVGHVRKHYKTGNVIRLNKCHQPLIVVKTSDHGIFCMYQNEIDNLVNPPEPAAATTAKQNLNDLMLSSKYNAAAGLHFVAQYESEYTEMLSTVLKLIAKLSKSVASDCMPHDIDDAVNEALVAAASMAALLPYRATAVSLPEDPSYLDYMNQLDKALDAYDNVKNTRYIVGNLRRHLRYLYTVIMPYSA